MSRIFESEAKIHPVTAEEREAGRAFLAQDPESSSVQVGRRYTKEDRAGSAFALEHGLQGKSYFFHLIPKGELGFAVDDVLKVLIAIMSSEYPESVQMYYTPPNERLEVNMYTIEARDLKGVPGWQGAVERTVEKLLEIKKP